MSASDVNSYIPVDFDPFGEPADAPLHFPMTEAQREVWASAQLGAEASSAYNVCHAFRVRGAFSMAAMETALQLLVDRHQALRLVCEPDGETQQEVTATKIPVILVDLSAMTDAERELQTAQYIERETDVPFDLEKGPLCRAVIIREERQKHLIVFTAHHIVCDGWAGTILIQDLGEIYEAESVGMLASLPPAHSFQSYVEAQNQPGPVQQALTAEQYWKAQFAAPVAPLELPLDAPRKLVKSFASERQRAQIPEMLYRDVARVASQNGCTLYTILFAAMQVLIQRLTGQNDFVLGTVVASLASIDNGATTVGHGTNVLPVRATVNPEAKFVEHLKSVRSSLLDAFDHQSLSFGALVRSLKLPRDPSRNPLVAVTFNSDQVTDPFRFRSVEAELLPSPKKFATFDVEFNILKTATAAFIECIHSTAIVHPATAMRWLHHFEHLLESICENPLQQVGKISLLTEEEARALLAPPRVVSVVKECLHERFEQQAVRTPDAIAVSCDGESLTYAQLNRRANAVAERLIGLGAGPEVLVGLCLERNLGLVVGVLGILKAGAAYLPIDLSYPAERVAFMLEDAGVAVLVSERSLEDKLPAYQGAVLFLEDVKGEVEQNPVSGATAENLAYVIYTSGSTGKPKGCQITHANVVRLMEQTEGWYGFGASDVWTLFHSCAFDFSVWELWGGLLYGGRVVVVPYWVSRSPEAFTDLLKKEGVTVLNQTPSAFRQLMPYVEEAIPAGEQKLRYVIFGGEALELGSLLPWMEQYGESQPQMINMYGITETTVHVTYRRIGMKEVKGGEGSLIGEPIADLAVYVLDRQGQPVAHGVTGEMYVGGAGVARGYLKRPELTAARFVESPLIAGRLYRTGDLARRLPNGELEYLGRIDDQVKIRGFRIELGEIEHALEAIPDVLQAAVVVHESGGDQNIVAYLVPVPGVPLTPAELRGALLQSLPEYMIPAAFVLMEKLPTTPNGKLDRKALPAPVVTRSTHDSVTPETSTQMTLARIWESLLKIENVGIHESFFDLGGHSILAVRLMAQIRSSFGIQLPLYDIFRTPTISSLASIIEAKLWTESSPPAAGPGQSGPQVEIEI